MTAPTRVLATATKKRATKSAATKPVAAKPAATKSGATKTGATKEIVITHPDRVLFPNDGLTKGELADYYRAVAPFLLPYLADRPLTLQRWPEGITKFSFFEKQVPKGAPDWVKTSDQASSGGKRAVTSYVVCDDARTLLWMANLSTITMHVWQSRLETIDHPDYALFDLDPWEGCTMKTLAGVALTLRETLGAIGLEPLVKTTGGKGLHVIVPLKPAYSYDQVRDFGEVVARHVHNTSTDFVTLERTKTKRPPGTVYMDWVQVGLGKTLVPPYVVRARDGAPVSMPLAWSEVETLASSKAKDTLGPLAEWNIKTVPALLEAHGDPWKTAYAKKQSLEAALKKARSAWGESDSSS